MPLALDQEGPALSEDSSTDSSSEDSAETSVSLDSAVSLYFAIPFCVCCNFPRVFFEEPILNRVDHLNALLVFPLDSVAPRSVQSRRKSSRARRAGSNAHGSCRDQLWKTCSFLAKQRSLSTRPLWHAEV